MIENRNCRILELIKQSKYNIFDISNELNISDRMLRYDIVILNQFFI
ncbi:hypothetical protein [Streptobacillus moniliformis]|nr:hypothetical protein [Streptobacillus moniliformis]